ncbi:MAG: ABC transporter ATP-binding protein [Clostridia bacterium]|nr:ABC transporter ATP-binding protein [Clostridia bacterium]
MIEIKNVTQSYVDGKTVIDNMSLTIDDGVVYGFIGPNGAGKTTTIEMITGVLKIDKGDILIDGHSIITNPIEAKKKFGFVPDSPDAYEKLTGLEYLNFIGDVYKVDKKTRFEKVEKLAKEFGIYDHLKDRIQSYSHGMRQKLIIISVLLYNPKNWILDEPMTGLDPQSSYVLKNLMREHSKNGNTVFFSTHVLEVAEKICDKIAIIDDGKIVFTGTIDEIHQKLKSNDNLEESFLKIIRGDTEDESIN